MVVLNELSIQGPPHKFGYRGPTWIPSHSPGKTTVVSDPHAKLCNIFLQAQTGNNTLYHKTYFIVMREGHVTIKYKKECE